MAQSAITRLQTAIIIIVVAAAVAGSAYFTLLQPQPTKTVNIAITVIPGGTVEDVPVYVAVERGFWSKRGLNVTLIPLTGGQSAQALITGVTQFATGGLTQVFDNYEKGITQLIIRVSKLDPGFVAVAPPNSNIRSPQDLRGKTIGITRQGSVTHALAVLLADTAGLKIPQDMKLAPVGGLSGQLAALKKGETDVFLWTTEVGYALEEKGEGRVVLVISDFIKGPWVQTGISAMRDYLRTNPDIGKRFVAGYQEAMEFVLRNPEEAAKITAKQTELSESAVLRALKVTSWSRDGRITDEALKGLQNNAELLKSLGLIKVVPPLNEIISNEFLP